MIKNARRKCYIFGCNKQTNTAETKYVNMLLICLRKLIKMSAMHLAASLSFGVPKSYILFTLSIAVISYSYLNFSSRFFDVQKNCISPSSLWQAVFSLNDNKISLSLVDSVTQWSSMFIELKHLTFNKCHLKSNYNDNYHPDEMSTFSE